MQLKKTLTSKKTRSGLLSAKRLMTGRVTLSPRMVMRVSRGEQASDSQKKKDPALEASHDTVAQIKNSFGKLIQLVKASKRNAVIAAVIVIALLFMFVSALVPGLFWHLDLDASVEACGLEVSYPSEWSTSSVSEDGASEASTSVIIESENGACDIVDKSFIYDDDFDAKDSSDCKEEFKKLKNSLGSKGFTLGQNGEMQVGERDGYTCVSQAVAFKNSDGNPCSGILTAVYVGNNEAYVFVGAEDGYKPDADMVERVAASAKVVKADPVTVTFESDGEIIQTTETYDMGGGASVKAPNSPKKDGYLLTGGQVCPPHST